MSQLKALIFIDKDKSIQALADCMYIEYLKKYL